MARITASVYTSHVPAIGGAIARGLQADPYWKPFFDGFPPVHAWLDKVKPDVAVILYNDHGLNFFLDKMPTFAVGAAPEYRNADEGWGIPVLPPFPGNQDLSWHLIESLIGDRGGIVLRVEFQRNTPAAAKSTAAALTDQGATIVNFGGSTAEPTPAHGPQLRLRPGKPKRRR